MKKIFALVSSLIMMTNFSFAQIITFDKPFDSPGRDKLVDVVQTSDGGYAAIGNTQGLSLPPLFAKFYVFKYNQFGDTVWTKAIGAPDWTFPSSIQQTSDGGYIICGQSVYSAKQAFIAKLDTNGNVVWQKLVGNANGTGTDWFSSAKQNPDGTYIAAGSTRRSNHSDSTTYVYLVKFDGNGNTLWEKTFGQGIGQQFMGEDLEITNGGGYLVTANTFDQNGTFKSILIKTDGQGVQQWVKQFPLVKSNSGKQTSDGGYIIAGDVNASIFSLGRNATLLKLNSFGDTIWTKKYPGVGANAVIQTTGGGYAFTGSILADTIMYGTWPAYFQNLLAAKTDASGNMRFMRTYGDSIDDAGFSIKQTTDGGFVIAGVKDWVFAVGVGPLGPGPDKGLLLKIEFTPQDAVLSVKENLISETLFNLFPNPATTQFTLELSEKDLNGGNFQLIIKNALGEQVLRKKVTAVKTVVERGNLSPGLYFVHLLEEKTGNLKIQKKLILK